MKLFARSGRTLCIVCATCLALAWLSTDARSAVIELRHAAANEASLIHHYTFEGLSTLGRQADKQGTADLQTQTMASGGTASNIDYSQGLDTFTTAMTPEYIGRDEGAALWTNSSITLPGTFTVEALVAPQPTANSAFAVASRASSGQRGYYLAGESGGFLHTTVGPLTAHKIVDPFTPGDWYYVANTYSVSGGSTTINSYVANLTTGGPLEHVVNNIVQSGNYGTSAPLAIGSLAQRQYPFAGPIDEVALYDTALDEAAITRHFAMLKSDAVVYREIFPNDVHTSTRQLSAEGWKAHYGATATATTRPLVEEYNTAFNADVSPVNSNPNDTGVTDGYLNNHGGVTTSDGYIYWTEEFGPLAAGSVSAITFDTRLSGSYVAQVALRVDDQWYLSADFDNEAGTSAFAHTAGSGTWQTHVLDFSTAEWTSLTFDEGVELAAGTTEALLPNGPITAFGLYHQDFTYGLNARFDNFTIRAVPEPGTWLLASLGVLLGCLLCRRRVMC